MPRNPHNNSTGTGKKPRWLILLLSVILGLVIAAVIGMAVYVGNYYHADPAAAEYLAGGSRLPEDVKITSFADCGIGESKGLYFDGPGSGTAYIFYPGAKVEYTAYAPLMVKLAEGGLDCFLVDMPENLAFLDQEAAAHIMNADRFYEAYDSWYVGGHSLGGAMAGDWAGTNLQDESLAGVVFLAAYPTKSLVRDDFRVLTIYGSNDGVLNRNRLQKAASYLPADARTVVIDGGNHAQFADYGPQKGDGTATIDRDTQQGQTVKAILELTLE